MKRIYDLILVLLVASSAYSAEPKRDRVPRLEAAKTTALETSKQSSKKLLQKLVTVTGYCNDNCKICCGIYASKTKPRTASGSRPRSGRTIACNFLKFKTAVTIKGKTYVVEDRLHPRYKDRIDIYFDTHQQAKDFGKQTIKVTILIKR